MAIQNGPPSRGSSTPARRAPTNFKVMRGNVAAPAAATAPGAGGLPGDAAAQANLILAPQLAQQAAYGQQQNTAIRSFANALLGKLQPIAKQVGGDYNQAINQIGGLSGQAAQYLNAQNPTPVQQALLSSVGAPPEQQAQSALQLGNTFRGGAGALAFTQGVVPGSELAGDKAAAQASARQLPGIAALKGQQDLASALFNQSQNRMKLEATRPGLVADAQSQIDLNANRAATLAQGDRRLTDQETTAATTADYKNRALAASTNYKYDALATSTDYKNRALAATNTYRQSQIDQSQQRTDLGYTKVAQSAADKKADRAATKAYHDSYLAHLTAGDSERVAHDKATEAASAERAAIAQQNADTGVYNANTSRINAGTSRQNAQTSRIRAQTAANKPPSATAPTTKTVNGVTYQWDPARKGYVRAPGLPTATPKKKGGSLSTEQARSETARIDAGLKTMQTGVAPDGTKHPVITSRDAAIAELEAEGYFSSPVLRRMALKILNRYYPPPVTVRSKGPFGVQATAAP
jgi:hypothetical protein